MKKVKLNIKTLSHFLGELPKYETEGAAGFDVRAVLSRNITLQSLERTLVPTGLCFEIPVGYEIQVRPRSGWAIKQGITLINSPGTIDSDYRGELKIGVVNLSTEVVEIKNQDRVAQLILAPVSRAEFEVLESLSSTDRGSGGFGSTGR